MGLVAREVVVAVVNAGASETRSVWSVEVQQSSDSPQHHVNEVFFPEQGITRDKLDFCSL